VSARDEIDRLTEAATDIGNIPDPDLRYDGGMWLNQQLTNCDDTYTMTKEERLDFMATVKYMFDVVFRDAKEESGLTIVDKPGIVLP
jgi:hypothetical protein